ncbi:MAG TPA: pitrilysin family protein, partial [Candidatus Cloacimonadota bacterium]|nr:pitrilysin family protein [Candidatus Cloacimonadota bacterium]
MKVTRLLVLLSIALIAVSNLSAQLEQIPLPQDPNLITGQLANGLTYYIMRNAKPEKIAELRLFVEAGSVNEDEDQLGLAHFTEHMAFNGTKNYQKSEVVDYLSSIGMGYYNGLNAMTSYDFTMYQLKIPTDNKEQLGKGFHILSDMAYQLSFDPEEIERERGVIIEEWRMGQNANSRVNDILNKVRYAGSRYAQRSPIGTYEVLSTFKHETLKRFYQDWYRPDLQSVVVIGDFDPDEILALIEQYFGVIPARVNPRPVQDFPVPDFPQPRAVVATDPEFPYAMIQASWKRESKAFATLADFSRELTESLCFMMLNDRFGEISLGENPPYTMAVSHSDNMLKGLANTNLFAITGEGKILQALRVLISEAERVRTHGFVQSEFDRAKTKLLSQMEKQVLEMNTRDSDNLVWELFDTLTHGEVYVGPQQSLQLTQALLQMIDINLVNAVIDELITEENLTVSYASNDRPGMQHPTEAELLAVVNEVKAAEIEAYEDNEINEPLLETIPLPGSITSEIRYPRSGICKWVLSNGITVFAKQTGFKADEILFTAKSPGGRSAYTPEQMIAAQILG